ncbi:MAG: glycosyltransferase family 39 protein [Limnohabitans sp.]|jgi:hypothetical protein|nr:glycosyltransferase family 39 protein [Limnohabitans sp.]
MKSMQRLVWCAIGVGVLCAALSLVPTETWAQRFAHPARVRALDGSIPEATLFGALAFRVALACAALAIPVLVACIVQLRRAERARLSELAVDERPRPSRTSLLILLVCVAVGALLRVIMAEESLWYDEISAFLSFAVEGPAVAFGSYAVPTNHVPMTIAVWASTVLTGSISELVMRAPALIAGIASIPAAWFLAREVAPSDLRDRAAPCAAFLAAIAPIFVVESAEARGYAFVICASLVGAWAWSRAQRAKSAWHDVLFACACAFAAWSHPVAVLVPCAAFCLGLWQPRVRAVSALLACTMTAVLFAPLLGDVLSTRQDYLRTTLGQPSLWSREGFEGFVGLSLSWCLPIDTLPWIRGTPLASWLVVPPIALLILFLIGAWRVSCDARFRSARDVMLPFALAFLLAICAVPLFGTWIYARFLLFAVPMSVVVMSMALALVHRPRTRLAIATLVTLQCALTLPFFWTKQPIRNAVEIVAVRKQPKDTTLTIGLPDNAVGFYALLSGFEATPTGFLGADFDRAPRDARFVIVLYPDRLAAETLATLDRDFDRTHRFEGWADWGNGAVEVWERSAARP